MAAATLLELQTAITDGGLRNRIQAALCKTAVSINFEDPGTPNHTNRFTFAGSVLKGDISAVASQAEKYVVAGYIADHPTDDLATLKGLILAFAKDTTTANLRGQKTDITGNTSGGVLSVTALTTAPVSGDTFVIQ